MLLKGDGIKNKTIAKILENNLFTKNEIYKKLIDFEKKEIN